MKIIDITYSLDEEIAVWPGDQKFEISESMTMKDGYSCNVSAVKMSLHTGTHTDAHYHYNSMGQAINNHNLDPYIGQCQVIDVSHANGERIKINDILCPITERRVLLKTECSFSRTQWIRDFKGLEPSLVEYLHNQGVILIGTDAPSVDCYSDKDLIAHQMFLKYDIYNLEGLKLEGVTEGVYELLALPLKFINGDASPIRAILRR